MFLCVQETIGLRMFSFEAESICVHDCLVGIGGCVAGGECVCVCERERERKMVRRRCQSDLCLHDTEKERERCLVCALLHPPSIHLLC